MCQRESEYYLTTVNAGPSEIDDLVQANDGLPRYFRIDTTGAKKSTDDLMKIALTDATAKALLIKLTLLGYPLYCNTENESRFIRSDRIRHHWPAIKEGTYSVTDEDVVYTFEKPASERIDKIIVIFSPINSTPRLSRYFWPSFSKLMKFVPPNTAILRIADVGGVKGAFYMDTTAQPRNGDAVHNLVAGIISEHSLENSDVVLFGASKGGTGAAYHGLRGGWKFVATDPILSDEWYEQNDRDYHFTTGGIFPRSKQEVFADLIPRASRQLSTADARSVVITSDRSPQYSCVVETFRPLSDRLTILSSTNPEINKHPDVAPKTIYAQVMSINSLLLGMSLPDNFATIP